MAERDAYLAEVLALSPSDDAHRIQELRRRHLRGAKKAKRATSSSKAMTAFVDGAADERARQAAIRELSTLQAEFWTADPRRLRQRIDDLALTEYPDLRRHQERLQLASSLREEVAALEDDERVSSGMILGLRGVLVAPPQQAAELRRRFIKTNTRGKLFRVSRKAVLAIREDHPGIWDAEETWFERILAAKKDRKDSKFKPLQFSWVFFAIWILIKVILAFTRS